ncbi:MAG TPA: carbohydrate ABC transporter permease [Limnochordales bacterium]|nr:carbohydrate ABC transporter permease [Limnochordales bacterium]
MRLVRFVLARIGFYVLVVLIGSFFALPLLWLFTAPFHPQATLSVQLPTEPTLANFAAVFRNTFAVRALFQNSVIQAGGAMILTTLVASLAAYALARVRLPGRDVLVYVLILFSSVVTGTAAMVPIFLLIFHMGLIDTHLGVILVFTGGLLPTAIFIMRDFVAGLPRSLEESAMVAGAGSWQILRQIVLPQVRPGMMVIAVWAFVNVWGGFLIPFILLRSPEKMPASAATYSFYTEAGTPVITLISAYALLYVLPALALYLFVNWRYGFKFFGGIKS